MVKLLFASAVTLVVAASCICYATLNSLRRPLDPTALKLICGLPTLGLIPFLIWGMFALPWWFPIASLALAWVIVPFIYAAFFRSSYAAAFAMLFALVGVGIGGYSVWLTYAGAA